MPPMWFVLVHSLFITYSHSKNTKSNNSYGFTSQNTLETMYENNVYNLYVTAWWIDESSLKNAGRSHLTSNDETSFEDKKGCSKGKIDIP